MSRKTKKQSVSTRALHITFHPGDCKLAPLLQHLAQTELQQIQHQLQHPSSTLEDNPCSNIQGAAKL